MGIFDSLVTKMLAKEEEEAQKKGKGKNKKQVRAARAQLVKNL